VREQKNPVPKAGTGFVNNAGRYFSQSTYRHHH